MKSMFAIGLCGFVLLLSAQVKVNLAQESDSTSQREATFRLPFHYGKIGVSPSQREKLKQIHNTYEERIEELRNQLKAVVSERNAAMEAELTAGQRLRLKELREESIQSKPRGQQPATPAENDQE
ncbi:hypothetical protein KOR42_32740 [Thalassoglobus neptunius]|uniref:LTXXQ motif protein n=1 Tax=Thalassoglobus neptunius TaxID=1938619 RepID=A0A5C5WPE5_9PLAN|nr:hypothetical protein [Thalassoglobus neptunius]TWT51991.1 hypothetical protein KOR42_32740 [Thalassoglobus neptunius]